MVIKSFDDLDKIIAVQIKLKRPHHYNVDLYFSEQEKYETNKFLKNLGSSAVGSVQIKGASDSAQPVLADRLVYGGYVFNLIQV